MVPLKAHPVDFTKPAGRCVTWYPHMTPEERTRACEPLLHQLYDVTATVQSKSISVDAWVKVDSTRNARWYFE